MKKSTGVYILIFLFAALLGCGTDHQTLPVNQTVAFVSEVVGTSNYQIQTMKFDGSAVTTVGTPDQYAAVFLSPDGKKATFQLYADGSQIGIMNVDGSGKTIFNLPGDNYEPQFTPDGSKILYRSYPANGGDADLILVNLDGSNPKNLTNQNGYCYHSPTVSPDGKTIAVWVHDKDTGLAIINTDGTGMKIINAAALEEPAFSADGKTLFATKWDSSKYADIYSVNVDGTNLKAITTDGYSWDPILVGKKILFTSWHDSQTENWADVEIYSMNPDGSNITRLTNNSVYDGFGGGD